jgi:hypothetical protein
MFVGSMDVAAKGRAMHNIARMTGGLNSGSLTLWARSKHRFVTD